MPGLVGFVAQGMKQESAIEALCAMMALSTDPEANVWDKPFHDDFVCAGRSHLGVLQPAAQPYHDTEHDLFVWMEGELFDTPGAPGRPTDQPTLLARLVAAASASGNWHALAELDGVYTAVAYDCRRGLVHLFCDRLGLRLLHWTVAGGRLAWASQSSALLALPGFRAEVSPRRVAQFLGLGNLLCDATWLEGVESVSRGRCSPGGLRTVSWLARATGGGIISGR